MDGSRVSQAWRLGMFRNRGVHQVRTVTGSKRRGQSGFQCRWVLFAALGLCLGGCDLVQDFVSEQQGDSNTVNVSGGAVYPSEAQGGARSRAMTSMRPADGAQLSMVPSRTQQTILIASFNIQAFGVKKVSDPVVVDRIAKILRLFDVVAIQEVRATDQTVLPQLIQIVNSQGARYDFILGPRLGRTDSKEQYCYVYDTSRILSSPTASYTVNDTADLLHREPLVGRFATRVPAGYPPFTFSLMNIHTDPGEVKQELPVMHTVLHAVREYEWTTAREDDVLMMGDLNAAPSKFGNLAKVPGIHWVISDQPTNTRRTELYDNILFDRGPTNEYMGRSGVLDMATVFGITIDEALKVSDHNPIWAEFSIVEQPSAYSTPTPSMGNAVMANQGFGYPVPSGQVR